MLQFPVIYDGSEGLMMSVHILKTCLALLVAGVVQLGSADFCAAGPVVGPVALTAAEEHLAAQIGFDQCVLLIVKEETWSSLHRLSGYDENGYQIVVNGFVAAVPHGQAYDTLSLLRKKFESRKYKYMVFLIEESQSTKIDKLGVLKGTDPYDIIRTMNTNGENDEVTSEEIIAKMKEWERQFPFSITGAENSWVEIEFIRLPTNLSAFAEEVYAFSPATVEDGAGTVAELIKEIRATHRLTLVWN